MTKKEKILEMFDKVEWTKGLSGKRTKILTYEHFRENGLNATIEYQEKYCDVIYARQILNKMGYEVFIGMGFHVYAKQFNNLTIKQFSN